MANMKFEVVVDASGALVGIKAVKDLTSAVNTAATATNNLHKAQDTHFNRQEKGVVGTASAARNFSKLTESIGHGSNGLVGAYAGLAANVFAVSAAFIALRQAAAVEQVMAGLEAAGSCLGLTYSVTTNRVHELAGGLLTVEEAARSTAQTMAAGFGTSELERLTQVAKDTSFALGRNMTDSMDRLTRGVIKLEPELLDELGIMVRIDEASKNYARQIGKTASQLTLAEKNQGFMNAVLAEGEAKFGGISEAAGDTTSIDKLGAAFVNMSHSILGALNLIAKPIAAIFSASPMALLGAMALFASSIKSQILPGLTEASNQAKAQAEAAKQNAAAKIAASDTKFVNSDRYKKLIKDATDASAIEIQLLQDVKNKENNLAAQREKQAAGQKSWADSTFAKKRREIDQIKEQIALTRELSAAQNTERKATGVSKALEATTGGNFGLPKFNEMFDGLQQAFAGRAAEIQSTTKALELSGVATTRATKLNNFLSLSMFKLTTAAKVFGAALLNMLPFIGTVIFALGILMDGAKELYYIIAGKGSKEAAQAFKDLGEVTKKASERSAEYLRIQLSITSAANKQVSSNILIANSVKEIIDAYQKAAAAKAAIVPLVPDQYNENMPAGLPKPKFFSIQSSEKADLELYDSMRKNKIEAEALAGLLRSELPGVAERTREALRRMYDEGYRGGARLKAALKEVDGSFSSVGEATKNVQEAFKEADKSAADFVKSMTPSTAYDGMVKSMRTVNSSIATYIIESGKAGQSSKDLAATLSGVGPEILAVLPTSISEAIEKLKEQNMIVSELESKQANLEKQDKKLNLWDNINLQSARSQVAVQKEKVFAAQEELVTIQKQFEEYQNLAIVGASLVALAQARVSKLNTFEIRSGAQVKQRMQAENAVLALQAKQIMLQVRSIELMLASTKAQLSINTALDDANKRFTEILGLQKQISSEGALQLLLTQSKEAADNKAKAKTVNEKNYYQNILNTIASQTTELRKRIELEQKASALGAAADAGKNQAKAILMATTSKELQAAKVIAENRKLEASELSEILGLQTSVLDQKNKMLAIEYQSRGVQETMAEALTKTVTDARKLRDFKKADISARFAQLKAEEEANKQATSDASAAGKEAIARSNRIIEAARLKMKIELDTLDIEERSNILAVLKLKTIEEINAELKSNVDQNLSIMETLHDTAAIYSEINEIKLRGEAAQRGSTLTPWEERNLAIEAADKKLAAAKEEYALKRESMFAEASLLQAKQEVALNEAALQREAAILMHGKDSAISKSYDAYVKALEQQTGKRIVEVSLGTSLSPLDLNTKSLNDSTTALKDLRDAILGTNRAEDKKPSPINTTDNLNGDTPVEELMVSGTLSRRPASVETADSLGGGTIMRSFDAKLDNLVATNAKLSAEREAAGKTPLILGPEAQAADIYAKAGAQITSLPKDAPIFDVILNGLEAVKPGLDHMMAKFEGLGPQGELVQAIGQGMFNVIASVNQAQQAFAKTGNDAKTMADKITAGAEIANSALSMISGMIQASAKMQTDAIDVQIAAEQRRDGKSTESVAKIAALEKKKDAIAKKAFEQNKKLQIAMAIISTASAAMQTFAALGGWPMGAIGAAAVGAIGAAQIAIIAGTQYQSTATPAAVSSPSSLSIGKRNDSIDLSKNSVNAGSEAAYITGQNGYGNNSYNFRRAAYGGDFSNDNYGHAGIIVGEKGPEVITPQVPITVTPNGKSPSNAPVNATFNINAVDAKGIEELLDRKRGYIIGAIREAANANGQPFLETVRTQSYERRAGSKL